MVDVTREEYDIIVKGIVTKIHGVKDSDTDAFVRRQIPFGMLQEMKESDTIVTSFRLEVPVKEVVDFIREYRKQPCHSESCSLLANGNCPLPSNDYKECKGKSP